MIRDLQEERREKEEAAAKLKAAADAGWRRARLGFKLLAFPVVILPAYAIWECGYSSGYLAALALH